MMQRLSDMKLSELRSRYEREQAYLVTYAAVNAVSEANQDLSAEEVWHEAEILFDEIRLLPKPNKQWKFQQVYSQLCRKYLSFIDDTGSKQRTQKQAENTAFLVLFDVVFMLAMAKKVEADTLDEHPYLSYILAILKRIGKSVLFHCMVQLIQKEDDTIEKLLGQELPEYDYLDENHKESHIECPLAGFNQTQIVEIEKLLREAAQEKKRANAKYTGANRDYLSCAVMALHQTKHLKDPLRCMDKLYPWLCGILGNLQLDRSDFEERFGNGSDQQKKKIERYVQVIEQI